MATRWCAINYLNSTVNIVWDLYEDFLDYDSFDSFKLNLPYLSAATVHVTAPLILACHNGRSLILLHVACIQMTEMNIANIAILLRFS